MTLFFLGLALGVFVTSVYFHHREKTTYIPPRKTEEWQANDEGPVKLCVTKRTP